jgi:addiction module HigA family antidote
MEPLGLSINRLARELRVPPARIHSLVHARRAVTADTALRLARYFDSTPAFWLNLQVAYDLEVATRATARTIARDVQPRPADAPAPASALAR